MSGIRVGSEAESWSDLDREGPRRPGPYIAPLISASAEATQPQPQPQPQPPCPRNSDLALEREVMVRGRKGQRATEMAMAAEVE